MSSSQQTATQPSLGDTLRNVSQTMNQDNISEVLCAAYTMSSLRHKLKSNDESTAPRREDFGTWDESEFSEKYKTQIDLLDTQMDEVVSHYSKMGFRRNLDPGYLSLRLTLKCMVPIVEAGAARVKEAEKSLEESLVELRAVTESFYDAFLSERSSVSRAQRTSDHDQYIV
ncbi:hypothetical protein I204_08309 [Kwoniella mangroviensis CBS 8886]|nr:hypothetical protein I204_08309 [Kwoniella mangroviensis CBS 8886]